MLHAAWCLECLECLLFPSDIGDDFWCEYVAAVRFWQNWTYNSALDDSRSEDEKKDLVDELYNRYQSQLVQYPDRYLISSYPMLYLQIKKI